MRFLLALILMTLPAQAGSLVMTWTNPTIGTLGVTTTISNADATTLITWCQTAYAGVGGVANPTAAQCLTALSNDMVNQIIQRIIADNKAKAAATAAAGTASPSMLAGQ